MDRIRNIHPGHLLLGLSLPFCYQGYRSYTTTRIETAIAQPIVQKFPDGYANESARRALGVAVASRALKVATLSSIGVFGVCCAGILYWTNASTMELCLQRTTDWAHRVRGRWDETYRIRRIDRNHPEYKEALTLTEEEELEKYFPAKDFVEDDVPKTE